MIQFLKDGENIKVEKWHIFEESLSKLYDEAFETLSPETSYERTATIYQGSSEESTSEESCNMSTP